MQVTDPATADFLVDYHVAVKTHTATVRVSRLSRDRLAAPLAAGPDGAGDLLEFGFENIRFHEGTFVFDLALRNPKKLAYRAISQKELNNRTISPYQAEHAVDHLLKDLKPR